MTYPMVSPLTQASLGIAGTVVGEQRTTQHQAGQTRVLGEGVGLHRSRLRALGVGGVEGRQGVTWGADHGRGIAVEPRDNQQISHPLVAPPLQDYAPDQPGDPMSTEATPKADDTITSMTSWLKTRSASVVGIHHLNADRLLVLTVDVGEEAPRHDRAGLATKYAPEDLVGRTVIVVVVSAGKLRGVVSGHASGRRGKGGRGPRHPDRRRRSRNHRPLSNPTTR